MTVLDRISGFADDLVAWRRDFHAHPEIGFEEERTAAIVAEKLASWGIEVHRGVGRTGVVGVLEGNGGNYRRIGLRADMDALPIEEATDLPYASTVPGKMHACGHDGHTTMLLGAARYLAETRGLRRHRRVHLPAGRGGARRRPRDAGRRAVRALPLRRGLRPAQPAGRAARQGHDADRRRDGGGGFLRHPHHGPAARTARTRTSRATRPSSP